MMMIPEAYADRDDLSDELKGFYAFHSCLMEPWDGPAAVCFTNGRVVGATLDRNGLRPGPLGRDQGRLRHPRLGGRHARRSGPSNVKRLGRLQPGKLFLVDLEQGRIVEDEEVKREVATQQPYGEWFDEQRRALRRPRARRSRRSTGVQPRARAPARLRLHAGGPARAAWRRWPQRGEEPIGSMGNDARAGRAVRPAPAAVHATSSSSSRRSPTRRSTRSASRS